MLWHFINYLGLLKISFYMFFFECYGISLTIWFYFMVRQLNNKYIQCLKNTSALRQRQPLGLVYLPLHTLTMDDKTMRQNGGQNNPRML